MLSIVARIAVVSLALVAQASAQQSISMQQCMVRTCVEWGWEMNQDFGPNGQSGEATTTRTCTKWANRINSKCAQALPGGINIPRPLDLQIQPR